MNRDKLRMIVPTVLAAATAALVMAQPAQAAPSSPGDMQLITTDGANGLAHTIRDFWGNWLKFGHLGTVTPVTELTSTYHNGEENAFFLQGGTMTHLIRHENGTWDMLASTPDATGVTQLATTDVAGQLTLVGLRYGTVQTSTQQDDGTWSEWAAVPTGATTVTDIAVVANGGTLRVVGLNADARNITEFDRPSGGAWTNGGTTMVAPDSGMTATEIAAAQVGDQLQVAAVETDGNSNSVYHAVRAANGKWTRFMNLTGPSYGTYGPMHVAVAPWEGDLQLAYSTGYGGLNHTVRYQDGTWHAFGNVEAAAGYVSAGPLTMAANPVN